MACGLDHLHFSALHIIIVVRCVCDTVMSQRYIDVLCDYIEKPCSCFNVVALG